MAEKMLSPEEIEKLRIKEEKKAAAVAANAAKAAAGGDKKKKEKFTLKTPKGTQDYSPEQMTIREELFDTLKTCFKRHGAVTIETPVFELKETLTGKYGEDSKLIYDLQDQGGEICSLRYDLTVPFARYVAMNRIRNIKRYHIARVYRRDNPVMTKGRFREFYQCDFDIAGEYDLMIPDAECIKLICEILDQIKVGNYLIKLNHRRLLDAIFAICGVPEDKFRSICSAVDKLDKSPWDEVRKEMVDVKHLDPAVADKIKTFVEMNGKPFEMLERIRKSGLCDSNQDALAVLKELDTLFGYLRCLGVADKVSFDLSLARGLDYYTGIIYEAVVTDSDRGSIAAGGRYDGLVGMYGSLQVPSVGFSIGIERIFSILEEEALKNKKKIRQNATQAYVVQLDKEGDMEERLKICNDLWNAGINAEFTYRSTPNSRKQFDAARDLQVPIAIMFGSSEIETQALKIKVIETSEEFIIPREGFTDKVKEILKELESKPVLSVPTTTTTTTTDVKTNA
ncbi:histidine-tRNA ligase [Heterostelium album PN500]|uniref:histidine--tRNA ligase n=1 Tax=Heterostelium pallidum (strain ATCC 26659 / Pp 5 / PN500) TaxID=670386 RepID=D3B6G4_HETP5|nr:histidine-tRNA ligase [Heterostelium album PN500]EFA82934.1 histidine-tRNA ligase [Heterostelium album PN500]|eukprot:XP_020435051.1 histidine-tRNA ligase [Heterostelium album PN500]